MSCVFEPTQLLYNTIFPKGMNVNFFKNQIVRLEWYKSKVKCHIVNLDLHVMHKWPIYIQWNYCGKWHMSLFRDGCLISYLFYLNHSVRFAPTSQFWLIGLFFQLWKKGCVYCTTWINVGDNYFYIRGNIVPVCKENGVSSRGNWTLPTQHVVPSLMKSEVIEWRGRYLWFFRRNPSTIMGKSLLPTVNGYKMLSWGTR